MTTSALGRAAGITDPSDAEAIWNERDLIRAMRLNREAG